MVIVHIPMTIVEIVMFAFVKEKRLLYLIFLLINFALCGKLYSFWYKLHVWRNFVFDFFSNSLPQIAEISSKDHSPVNTATGIRCRKCYNRYRL